MISQADAGFVKLLLICIHHLGKGGGIYADEQAECQLEMEVIGLIGSRYLRLGQSLRSLCPQPI